MLRNWVMLVWLSSAAVSASVANAQMIHTSTPLTDSRWSFYETSSIAWSLRGPNWFANFGGGGPLLPPFGNPDPGAGLSGGFGFSGGGVSGGLRFNFAQGSQQTISSTTPSLTTTSGFPGSISSGEVRPFVIGFTPVVGNGFAAVVGDFDAALAPLNSANQTASQIQQQQLQSLRQSQAVLRNEKLAQYLRRAARAESDGNKRMARANYRGAIALAPQPLKSQLQQRLQWVMQSPAKE